jgi:hypothetical protein
VVRLLVRIGKKLLLDARGKLGWGIGSSVNADIELAELQRGVVCGVGGRSRKVMAVFVQVAEHDVQSAKPSRAAKTKHTKSLTKPSKKSCFISLRGDELLARSLIISSEWVGVMVFVSKNTTAAIANWCGS